MFNFFPPSWAEDELRVNLGHFERFDQALAATSRCCRAHRRLPSKVPARSTLRRLIETKRDFPRLGVGHGS